MRMRCERNDSIDEESLVQFVDDVDNLDAD
jgi:hypothetical protein